MADGLMVSPVTPGFGSTPTMMTPSFSAGDTGVKFDADVAGGRRTALFALSKSKTDGWKVGAGWVYCGLEKVDVGATTLGDISSDTKVYLHVMENNGAFTATVSKNVNDNAIASIVLYEFEEGKLKWDGRLAPIIPLYN